MCLHLKALKSCSAERVKSQQQVMFEHILNLTIDLVHLATHRDLFMCLTTYNSRKFLIEIVNQFPVQILVRGAHKRSRRRRDERRLTIRVCLFRTTRC